MIDVSFCLKNLIHISIYNISKSQCKSWCVCASYFYANTLLPSNFNLMSIITQHNCLQPPKKHHCGKKYFSMWFLENKKWHETKPLRWQYERIFIQTNIEEWFFRFKQSTVEYVPILLFTLSLAFSHSPPLSNSPLRQQKKDNGERK